MPKKAVQHKEKKKEKTKEKGDREREKEREREKDREYTPKKEKASKGKEKEKEREKDRDREKRKGTQDVRDRKPKSPDRRRRKERACTGPESKVTKEEEGEVVTTTTVRIKEDAPLDQGGPAEVETDGSSEFKIGRLAKIDMSAVPLAASDDEVSVSKEGGKEIESTDKESYDNEGDQKEGPDGKKRNFRWRMKSPRSWLAGDSAITSSSVVCKEPRDLPAASAEVVPHEDEKEGDHEWGAEDDSGEFEGEDGEAEGSRSKEGSEIRTREGEPAEAKGKSGRQSSKNRLGAMLPRRRASGNRAEELINPRRDTPLGETWPRSLSAPDTEGQVTKATNSRYGARRNEGEVAKVVPVRLWCWPSSASSFSFDAFQEESNSVSNRARWCGSSLRSSWVRRTEQNYD